MIRRDLAARTSETFAQAAFRFAREREEDRKRFHGGPNGSQAPEAGPVGIEAPDGLTYCVGCAWCEPQERVA